MVCLEIENVSKSFLHQYRRLEVLKNITLKIKDGEFVCVVGPSGCGKTTLLNIIAGLESADEGKILHGNRPVAEPDPERLIIFQDLALFPWLSVIKNVEFGLKIKGVPVKERRKIAVKYLEMVNLGHFKNSLIHELSGGMKQRVALARAMAMDPQILLMDEPFAALDAQNRDILHEELQKIWQETKKTIVFVTHNVREAVCLGDRVIVFSAQPARIKAEFAVNLNRPRHIENPGLIEIARNILGELKGEIEKVRREEFREQKVI